MKKLWIFAACAAVFAAGCSNDEDSISGGTDKQRIVIDPVVMKMDETIDSRATDIDFEQGDAIGLNVTMAEDGSEYLNNSKLVFNGTDFVSEGDLFWYQDCGLKSNMVAYYPYAEAAPAEFTVKADQSVAGNYTASDLMIGFKDGVMPSNTKVVLPFKHMLTKLVVNMNNKSCGQIKSVAFKGTIPTAVVDLAGKTVAVKADGTAQDIIAKKVAEKDKMLNFAAIVIPQNAKLQLAVTVEEHGVEKVLEQTYKQIDLKSGQYVVTVDVLAEKIEMSLSGEIEDWTDNGTLEPEPGVDPEPQPEVPFEEFADHFVYDGVRYGIKEFGDGRVWMTENLRYIPEGVTVSGDPSEMTAKMWYTYTVDEKGICTADPSEEAAARLGYLYNTEVAFGTAVTPENAASLEGIQGICPKGWHIPTRKEFADLFGYAQRSEQEEEYTNTEAPFYDQDWKGARHSVVNAAGWNIARPGTRFQSSMFATSGNYQKVLSKDGGLGLTYYMSSTYFKTQYDGEHKVKNLQFFALMTTMVGNYIEDGRLHVAYNNIMNGVAVRCIKDK